MATTSETISSALNLIDSKKQNLKNAFENLQSQSSSFPLSWLQLDSHFTSLQQSLLHRFQFLQSLEQQSQSKTLISNPNHENSNKLRVLCEKMDGIGLKNYVSCNIKDKFRVQAELREALRFSPDAGMMVLQSLEGFYGVNGSFNHKGMREMGRVCVMLLRVLSVSGVNVSGKARERVLKVAIGWKARLMGDCANILGALGFLYLVYAFGIVNEFSVDELVEFGVVAAINGEFMQLCRKIGLTDKIPGKDIV